MLSAKKTSYAKGLSFFASFGAMFMAIPAVLIGAIAASTSELKIDLLVSLLFQTYFLKGAGSRNVNKLLSK